MYLAIIWGEVGIKVGQLLLSLSILVILHEFGHFITARWFGCRVEKFYLFFDPYFSLFKKKIGDTEYGVGWLPLGGYVKISGMVDESMDKEALKEPAKPYEFRSKPAWQRLIIMIGGVVMNLITAYVIYFIISMTWGEKKVPVSSLKHGIWVQDSLLYDLGFKDGDHILEVNGKPTEDFLDLPLQLVLGDSVKIKRDGQVSAFKLPVNLIGKLMEKKRARSSLVSVRVEPVVMTLAPDSTAVKAGFKLGDKIISVDSIPVSFYDQVKPLIVSRKGQTIPIEVLRDGQALTISTPVSEYGYIGIAPALSIMESDSLGYCKLDVTKHSFSGAFTAAFRIAGKKLSDYVDQMKKIFSPKSEGYKAIGGFKSMGGMFAPVWDWESFWNLTAMLSIILAVMNMLPIPALDGGHVLFTLIEMITGRAPNQKFLEYAQMVGMVILLGLMLYANGNDWFGWGRGR